MKLPNQHLESDIHMLRNEKIEEMIVKIGLVTFFLLWVVFSLWCANRIDNDAFYGNPVSADCCHTISISHFAWRKQSEILEDLDQQVQTASIYYDGRIVFDCLQDATTSYFFGLQVFEDEDLYQVIEYFEYCAKGADFILD